MRMVGLSLIVLFLSGIVFGQQEKIAPEGFNVTVVEKKWRLEVRNPELDKDPFLAAEELIAVNANRVKTDQINREREKQGLPPLGPTTDSARVPIGMPPGKISGVYVYELRLKNDGDKTIKKVVWNYIFTDAKTGAEVARQTCFTSIGGDGIKPGKTKNLTARFGFPPDGAVKADAGKASERVEIQGIEFADGSTLSVVSKQPKR